MCSCTIFVALWSYILVFASTYVLENFALLSRDFGMNSYRGNYDEPIKRDYELLNALLLQFFRSVKCFIASSLQLLTLG
jgi:hypothetical protein